MRTHTLSLSQSHSHSHIHSLILTPKFARHSSLEVIVIDSKQTKNLCFVSSGIKENKSLALQLG